MLNYYSEGPGVFVPNTEMNDEDDVNLPFNRFHIYINITSCSFYKHLFSEHVKTRPWCMNTEKSDKGKFKTRKSLVLKECRILDFQSEYFV